MSNGNNNITNPIANGHPTPLTEEEFDSKESSFLARKGWLFSFFFVSSHNYVTIKTSQNVRSVYEEHKYSYL